MKSTWKTLSEIAVGNLIAYGPEKPVTLPQNIHPDLRAIFTIALSLRERQINVTPGNIAFETGADPAEYEKLQERASDDPERTNQLLVQESGTNKIISLWQNEMKAIVHNPNLEYEEKLIELNQLLQSVTVTGGEGFKRIEEALNEFTAYTNDLASGRINLVTLPEEWGSVAEDAVLIPGDAMALLGWTGDGKTSALIQMAINWVRQGYDVYFVTAETTRKGLGGKVMAGAAGVGINTFLRHGVSQEIVKKVETLLKTLSGNLYVYSAYAPDISSIIAVMQNALTTAAATGRFPLFIVDYIQKTPDLSQEKEYQQFAGAVNKLKDFAVQSERYLQHATNVVIGSQINDGKGAFGSKQIGQQVQVTVRIERREEAEEDLKVSTKDGQVHMCPRHGMIYSVKTKTDGTRVCPNCNRFAVPMYFHRKGSRSAWTDLVIDKNNNGSTGKQRVLMHWYSVNAFQAK